MIEIAINEETAKEVQNISHGVFSPLEGFLTKIDFLSVVERARLANGKPWAIPIILDLSSTTGIKEREEIALCYQGKPIATMYVEEVFSYDKDELAYKVYGTTDTNHPGVAKVFDMDELFIGGKIEMTKAVKFPFSKYYLQPSETRLLFKKKGWKTVVAFQTRNIPHMGHEYLQKVALTLTDGLFINPVIGQKKANDYSDEVILKAYKILIDNYYPKDRVVMSILPMEMRYAGPREAIHHAIIRRNFGCTHFIVGRDHAGVGDYYEPYAAQEIFEQFPDLGITPIFFRSFFYCKKCLGVMNEKTCPHGEKDHIDFSGTRIKQILDKGEMPPQEVMRLEVSKVVLGL